MEPDLEISEDTKLDENIAKDDNLFDASSLTRAILQAVSHAPGIFSASELAKYLNGYAQTSKRMVNIEKHYKEMVHSLTDTCGGMT